MTTRAPIKRAPIRQPTEGGDAAVGGIQYRNIVRKSALDVRDVEEASSSELYTICRTKANQVMMMKHRGYTIPVEEQGWLECSLDEDVLVQKCRSMLGMTMKDIIKRMNQTYVIQKTIIPSQTTYSYYPYIEGEGSEELRLGEFFFRNGTWELARTESDLTETREYTTEVIYTDDVNLGDYALSSFEPISKRIIVYLGDEKSFKKEIDKMVTYRKMSTELFHTSELFVDYFQHFLVPHQQIISDVDKIKLLSSHLMIRSGEADGKYRKVVNCYITEQNLPSIHHTDIVMRYLGALPGSIIHWSNESFISSFVNQEFGYMQVVGYKYTVSRAQANMFPGDREPLAEEEAEELEEDMEEEEEIEEEEEDFEGGGGEED